MTAPHEEGGRSPMPEFAMPAEVAAPPLPSAIGGDAADASDTDVRGIADAVGGQRGAGDAGAPGTAADAGPRRRIRPRHLLVAGVIGALVGAAIPGGVELAERAAAGADEAQLQAVAMDYLTAIAEGRANEAFAMEWVEGGGWSPDDAALRSAAGIADPSVRFVEIDGDAGSVELRYRVGETEVARMVDAVRIDGWRLAGTLAEPVDPMYFASAVPVTVGGVPLEPGGGAQLYPGRYTIDGFDGPILQLHGEAFVVDGDPATETLPAIDVQVTPETEERVVALAVAAAEACQASQPCMLPPSLELQAAGAFVFATAMADDFVDLSVQLSPAGDLGPWYEVAVRAIVDADGVPVQWLCGRPGEFDPTPGPCPAIG